MCIRDRDNYIVEGSHYSNYIIFDFINTCGFYNCPLPNMTISDDTIFHLSMAKAFIESNESGQTSNGLDWYNIKEQIPEKSHPNVQVGLASIITR